MGGRYTETAADRPDYFSCFIGKKVKLTNESKVPMLYRNRIATVIYQAENFLVIAYDECDGWAPRVCSVSDIRVIESNDCYEDEETKICSVDECRNDATEMLHITTEPKEDKGTLFVAIPLCFDCYELFLSADFIDDMVDGVNEKYDVRIKIVEKNLD